MHWPQPKSEDGLDPPIQDIDHLIFKLQITCKANKNAPAKEEDPTKRLHHAHVYARDIVWQPIGRQAAWLGIEGIKPEDIPEHLRPRCANPDILLAKLRASHELELEMHAVKGCGQDHAKFSPVATATYRLLPTIDIMKPILGKDAVKFQECFPPGVIGLETVTPTEAARTEIGYEGQQGTKMAVVKDAFSDTVSRECLRHEEFQGKVKLGRQRDHFIFSIESTGQYHSDKLFAQSVRALRAKCAELKDAIGTITL
jgi:DNA-directed RNA polymerases I and III subunit RPAC1